MKKCFNKPEILAPVGGSEQLTAAVRSGADAVYFGLQSFNARRNAENFAGDGLADTIAYCRARNVKVYITINILVKDGELEDMKKAVDTAALAGADAVIVQDLAVAKYIRSRWPSLPMFASTQMVCHNAEGVRELLALGFKRVVLARELSLSEIKSIIEETGAETEVFVHGAHCMSVSGACYMSAMIGGRSGNRGLCAQPCRLDWQLGGRNYALSLKDLSYVTHMRELAGAGVCSFKIEGRMKRAEYVAAAVTACREGLEGKTPDMETLRSVFSRSGFTDGHLTNRRGPEMFGYRTKDDVTAAAGVFKKLQHLYEKERQSVPVDMMLSVSSGEAVLTASDGEFTAVARERGVQKAEKLEISAEYAKKSLAKTGGTQYYLNNFDFEAEPGLTLSASSLNALRRNALEELDVLRSAVPDYSKGPDPALTSFTERKKTGSYIPGSYPLRIRYESFAQLAGKKGEMPDFDGETAVVLPASEIKKHPGLIEKYKDALFAEIPAMLWPGQGAQMKKLLKELADQGLAHAACDNIGAIEIAREAGLSVHGGFCLNALNSDAVSEYEKLGLSDICLSMELSYANQRRLRPVIDVGTVIYGRLPLMKFRACPARAESGCAKCSGLNFMTDRMGESFPLICRNKSYSEALNCVPQYTADKSVPSGCFKVIYFTIESSSECENIITLCKAKGTPSFRRTAGLTQREVD